MRAIETVATVEIPEGVEGMLDGRVVTIKGENGELTRDFSHAPINIQLEGKTITVQASWPRKKEAALVGTVSSHIQNMIKGVTAGFTFKLKIVFSHFPITVKIQGKTLIIQNFTGERNPRKAKIMGDTKVTVKGEDIIVQGINLEEVSQTAANIQNATKIKIKDPRVFLDGIYVYEQHEGIQE
ncbi:MAG TPA: 50S ribosomal protein L6 [Candidatus Bathyarchaeota archaeon]|nr:50S ribosomal protein L6 [Candidatus Bathyarchaeota archaeon]